ncbi:MAG: FAD:protein FMN transferase ApbE, partial [Pirellulaceae bacterium]|nr:FAD:protein FMN transferase ApbE [Pirellulaceae bacterium]
SATVLADRCSQADGLATAMIVLGPEAALEWAERDGIAVSLLVREKDRFVERRSTSFPSPSAD